MTFSPFKKIDLGIGCHGSEISSNRKILCIFFIWERYLHGRVYKLECLHHNQKLNSQMFREMEKAKDFQKKRNLCEIGLKYTQVSSAHGFSFVGNTELPW